MTRAIVVVIATTSLVLAQPASDKPTTPGAQARFEAGTKAYKARDFAGASKEFAAGFAAESWSGFLFAWAQSERLRGDCPSALKLYARFLATNPPAKATQLAEDGVAVCKAGTPLEPPPREAPPPEPPAPTVDKVDTPVEPPRIVEPRAEREPGFPHKLAVGLGVGAALATGVGVYGYVSSSNLADAANRATTHPEAEARYDRARTRRLLAHISTGVGVGLAGAAVLRFVLHRPPGDDRVSVGLGGVTFTAHF